MTRGIGEILREMFFMNTAANIKEGLRTIPADELLVMTLKTSLNITGNGIVSHVCYRFQSLVRPALLEILGAWADIHRNRYGEHSRPPFSSGLSQRNRARTHPRSQFQKPPPPRLLSIVACFHRSAGMHAVVFRLCQNRGESSLGLTNQVRAQLWRYFPQVLELGFALHSPVIRALWTRIPTPARAHRVRQPSVEKILKKHRIRRIDAAEALQILRAKPITVADGVVNAATARIRLILEQLALLEKQIREADQAIDHLLATLNVQQTDPAPDASETGGNASGSEPSSDNAALRDVEILSSLPGVGNKVLATLISEASALLNDRDYQGPAPDSMLSVY